MRSLLGDRRLAAGVMLLAAVGLAAAADQEKGSQPPPTVLKTQDGLRFRLPEDWPIEKRNGVLGPIPVEEYLSKKFSAMESRIRALEQQVGVLDVRVRVLEEQLKKQQLRSAENPP